MTASRPAGALLLLLAAAAAPAAGDGTGLIGFGKTMYNPPCAFACRGVIARSELSCTPGAGGAVHGSGHSTTPTPPSCYTSDAAFLRTLALCIDTYCPASDSPRLALVEDYWAGHVGTGTVGNWANVPVMSYQQALALARRDEAAAAANATQQQPQSRAERALAARHGGHDEPEGSDTAPSNSSLPIIKSRAPLNVTSFIARADWQKQYNGLSSFEINEAGHARYT